MLHTSDVARKVCVTAGRDVVGNLDDAGQISKISRERFAPDAIDSILQDVVKFTYPKCTDQDMDTGLLEFDALRRKAETRMLMGAGFYGACKTLRWPKMRKRWLWPARAILWPSRRFQPRCDVYFVLVAMRRGRTYA